MRGKIQGDQHGREGGEGASQGGDRRRAGSGASTCKGPGVGRGRAGRPEQAGRRGEWQEMDPSSQQGAGSRGTCHKDPIYIFFYLKRNGDS